MSATPAFCLEIPPQIHSKQGKKSLSQRNHREPRLSYREIYEYKSPSTRLVKNITHLTFYKNDRNFILNLKSQQGNFIFVSHARRKRHGTEGAAPRPHLLPPPPLSAALEACFCCFNSFRASLEFDTNVWWKKQQNILTQIIQCKLEQICFIRCVLQDNSARSATISFKQCFRVQCLNQRHIHWNDYHQTLAHVIRLHNSVILLAILTET